MWPRASAKHASDCKLFAAELIMKGQKTGLLEFLEKAGRNTPGSENPFALTNMILDETELELGLRSYELGSWSDLASHSLQ